MKIKNSVGKWGKNISPELARKFGITNAEFHRAMQGDERAAKKIGQMANEGEIYTKQAPKVAQRMLQIISGTSAMNEAVTTVSLAAAQATKQIEANGAKVQLADQKLVNDRKEQALRHVSNLELNTSRHNNNLEAIQMEASIAETTARVDHNYRMAQLQGKIPLQQMRADKEYQEARTDHLLEYGDKSRLSLIPKREYETNFVQKVVEFFLGR